MMQTMLAIFITIMILRAGHSSSSKPVPAWIRNLVLHRLAKVVCMHHARVEPNRTTPTDGRHNEGGSALILEGDDTQDSTAASTPVCKLPPDVMEILSRAHGSAMSREQEAEIEGDWMKVAMVLDRICFILFLVIIIAEIVVFTLVMLFSETSISSQQIETPHA